jgi:hypothetical protein
MTCRPISYSEILSQFPFPEKGRSLLYEFFIAKDQEKLFYLFLNISYNAFDVTGGFSISYG